MARCCLLRLVPRLLLAVELVLSTIPARAFAVAASADCTAGPAACARSEAVHTAPTPPSKRSAWLEVQRNARIVGAPVAEPAVLLLVGAGLLGLGAWGRRRLRK